MPGPVSDSYDPELGTAANAGDVRDALDDLYTRLTLVIGQSRPIHILDLVRADLPTEIQGTLTERDWRLIRFAVEHALDSIG